MRTGVLLREAMRSMLAQRVPAVMVATLAAAMCVSALLTVGRTAAGEDRVASRMEQAGARHLRVIDAKNKEFLTPGLVQAIAGLSTVDRALGFGLPADVTNSAIGRGGTPVPAWVGYGHLGDAVELTAGRWPGPGEAIASENAVRQLGMAQPAGAVLGTGRPGGVPVVGAYQARSPYDALQAGVLIRGDASGRPHVLDIVVATAGSAGATQRGVLLLLNRADPTDLAIESPTTLADVQREVLGDLGETNASLLWLVLCLGAGLIAVVVLSDVLLRRSDLGRRRALGAPRWALVALVTLRTVYCSIAGTVVGTAVGSALLARDDQAPGVDFVAGTAILAVLAAGIAALPPAMVAARQDPVRVLRTP